MDRRLVLDIEIDVDGAGRHAGTQCRRHAAIGPLVERDDVLGDIGEIGNGAFLQRRRAVLDPVEVEVTRVLDPQPSDLQFRHLEGDHAAGDILLRDRDADGLVALVVIRLLQRGARLLDILRGLARTEERIDGLLDLDLGQLVGALHREVVDVEALQRRRRLLRRRIRLGRLLAGRRRCGRRRGILRRARRNDRRDRTSHGEHGGRHAEPDPAPLTTPKKQMISSTTHRRPTYFVQTRAIATGRSR